MPTFKKVLSNIKIILNMNILQSRIPVCFLVDEFCKLLKEMILPS